MTIDDSVTAALETAIQADPRNPALRTHLASLLLMNGDAQRALEHAQAALAQTPDDAEALALARDAARAAGQAELSDRYGRLLGITAPAPPPAEDTDPITLPAIDDEPDELELEEGLERLLAEFDGAHAGNEGMFVLAATNHP
jgi:tetratricopeptide (TPR) repeat protein